MIVNTNVQALNSLNALKRVETGQGKTLKKLASGKRVNTAADDVAVAVMRENKQALIRGSEQAVRNAQDGVSLAQTAQGGIDTVQDMVERMRELCIEAANDTLDEDDRDRLQKEIDQLNDQITKIATETTFNGRTLLNTTDASGDGLVIHVSSQPAIQVTIERTDITAQGLGTNMVNIKSSTSANDSLKILDNAIETMATEQTKYGAYQESFEQIINTLNTLAENATASCSIITDADMAAETIKLAKYNLLKSSTDIMLANANKNPETVLTLLRGE